MRPPAVDTLVLLATESAPGGPWRATVGMGQGDLEAEGTGATREAAQAAALVALASRLRGGLPSTELRVLLAMVQALGRRIEALEATSAVKPT